VCDKTDIDVLETTVKQHNEELSSLKCELRAGLMTLCDSVDDTV